ncbi:hypothetical protein KW801_03315 [Candidatus Saccharibacteria bacterium]|nr:hypothetical protein [Candidatus Saccharibacteria bacterium]
MDAPQVLIEAKAHWHRIKQTTRNDLDSVYDHKPRLRGFSAFNALKKVEIDDYPDDPFWRTVNWDSLERTLITAINEDLAPDSDYQLEMQVRNHRHVATV